MHFGLFLLCLKQMTRIVFFSLIVYFYAYSYTRNFDLRVPGRNVDEMGKILHFFAFL